MFAGCGPVALEAYDDFAMDLLEPLPGEPAEGGALDGNGDTPGGDGEVAPVHFTSTRRLLLQNFFPADAMILGRWAEELIQRFEDRTGRPVEVSPREPIRWTAREDVAYPAGRVMMEQSVEGDRLMQRLWVIHPGRVSAQALREAMVELLAVRLAMAEGGLGEPVTLPGWLISGVSQVLFPESRQDAVARVAEVWEGGRGFYLTEILEWEDRSALNEERRAWAGAMVAWIHAEAGPSGLSRVIAEAGSGGVDEAFLAGLTGAGWIDGTEVRRSFDLWLARQRDRILPLQASGRDRIRRVEGLLEIQSLAGLAAPEKDVSLPASLADMIERREEVWIREWAGWLTARLQAEAIAGGPELAEAVEPFLDVLKMIVGEASRSGIRWRASKRAALRRLDQAEAGWTRFRVRAEAQAGFLDAVEAAHDLGQPTVEQEGWNALEALREAMIGIWLDGIEADLPPTPSGFE